MLAALEGAGHAVSCRLTERPGQATEWTREALKAGATTLIVVGGDGTLHEVVNGCFEGDRPLSTDAALVLYPGGTGSDWARTVPPPRDPAALLALLARRRVRAVDCGRARFLGPDGAPATRHFLNTASAGLSGAMLARRQASPAWLPGGLAYALAALGELPRFRPRSLRYRLDGGAWQNLPDGLLVVVGNGRCFGGGMRILPQAEPDDGLLDVLMVEARPLTTYWRHFAALYRGSHLTLPFVSQARCRALELDVPEWRLELDGEQPGFTPAAFEVVPAALRLLV